MLPAVVAATPAAVPMAAAFRTVAFVYPLSAAWVAAAVAAAVTRLVGVAVALAASVWKARPMAAPAAA